MNKIREWLQGNKTYFVCVGAIIAAIIGYADQTIGVGELVAAIFAAAGGITIAAKVNRAAKNSAPK